MYTMLRLTRVTRSVRNMNVGTRGGARGEFRTSCELQESRYLPSTYYVSLTHLLWQLYRYIVLLIIYYVYIYAVDISYLVGKCGIVWLSSL